jgi:hypothetical protein
MKVRLFAFLACVALLAGVASAQTTGEIYGKVTDKSGAVVPGATVSISSPVLIQPLTAVSSSTGNYRFPNVPIGVYTVKFELAGFTTVVNEGIRLEIGQNAQVNAALNVSGVQEVVTITAESPLVDVRNNGRTNSFNQEALQNVPSGRDPWVVMQQSAGIVMDRENIGGNQSGQQSNFTARAAAFNQSRWNLDGVDITDMSALGATPVYYDFDAFEEMSISTGGADATMMTPGVAINLVTKNATDKFKGSGRFYLTPDGTQSVNITDDLRRQGASSGNPIQDIKDYGLELGGPIVKGKLWAWGSYGTQDVKVGVNGFYLNTGNCPTVKATPLNYPIEDVWACLSTDLTTLNTYNAKLTYQMSRNDQFSFLFNAAEKVRNARDASDLRPEETTYRQKAVTDPALGSSLWKTGVPKTYKGSWRHIFSDRFAMELQYAHVGNNFVLDFHEDSLKDVQPMQELATGLWARSFQNSQFVRPTNLFDLTGTRSSSGFMGGDHAIKFGVRYRQDRAVSTNHRGGNVEARFRSPNNDFTVPTEANMYRDSLTDYNLFSTSFYLQDTFTKGRLTAIAGLRYDRQWDRTNASAVPAHPFFGQATATGAIFNHLPAFSFAGRDGGVTFADFGPRLGLNWDLKGDGRSVVKVNYAMYANQLGDGDIASTYNPVQASFIRFPWADRNGDKVVQANEITITGTPLSFGGNYNPNDPTGANATTPGTVDPNLKNSHTHEGVLAFDKQIGNTFAFGVAGIYRKYNGFRWNDRTNWSTANYVERSFTPPAASCPAAQNAQCPTVAYFEPTSAVPAAYVYTMQPGYSRDYKGVELTFRKRVAKTFFMNGSVTLQDGKEFFGPGSFEDPSNIANRDGAQYAPESAGSGQGNVFQNARWIGRASAAYTLPWQEINLAGTFEVRDGYPMPLGVLTPTRANGAGQTTIYTEPLGDIRLDTYNNLNLRLDKSIKVHNSTRITLSVDAFNVFNNASILARQRTQNANNANNISALVAPRVFRFGARLNW